MTSLPYVDYNFTPRQELYDRVKKFQNLLVNNNINGALIVQKADLFYFSGTCQNANLFIPAEGEPILMVRKSLRRSQVESNLENIVPVRGMDEILKNIFSQFKGYSRIGLEMDVLPANLFLKYKNSLNSLEVVDVSKLIRETRAIKSPYEIDRLKESANLNFIMFSQVLNVLREGMTEVELAGTLESIYRSRGHQGAIRMRGFNQEIFYGHLMSGWNLSYPSFFDGPTGGTGVNPSYPQSAGFKRISKNEPIMIDYVGVCNGYMVDQARIFSIGKLQQKLVGAYETALKIKAKIINEARPGTNGKDLYEIACNIATDSGYQDYFMGYEDRISFIGHGIGIELDEFPVIAKNFNMLLKPGMVFALEPKFVFPEEGAIGIEDTFVLTNTGLEQITFFDESIQFL